MNGSQQMSQLEALIAHARKNEDIARRMFNLEVAILNISSVQDFLELLHAHLREHFGIDEVWYAIIDKPATQCIRSTLERSEKLGAHWRSVAAVDFHAALKGAREPVLDHCDLSRFRPLTPHRLRPALRSIASLPLLLDGRLAGSLNLGAYDEERYQAGKEAFFLHQLAVKVSLCLSSVVAREKIEFLATRDPLTHLRNRREMEETLEHEISRVHRHGSPLALAFLDCDDFKKINDEYGHETGDQYLQHLANLLVLALRKTDLAFRFAGDEFVILLPNQDEEGAALIAERICECFRENPLIHGTHRIPVKASIGTAATTSIVEPTGRKLLKLADERLYRQKAKKSTSSPA
ncbi:hypothetical protein GCM10022278_04530 [Allohahella marinimesophila]|uniref:GGDEF domain-containing protein n=2 Tax=Allohahella marinimesophila TaxID=1054972 RepID=A0ABP7NK99_9GAMM